MYTSFGKVNDRFGFSMSGKFRCAYENTRSYLTTGMIIIGVLVALLAISVVYLLIIARDVPYLASQTLNDIIYGFIYGEANAPNSGAGNTMVQIGYTILGIAFGLFLLLIAVIVFFIILINMRMGQEYGFKADENVFIVTYPEKMHKVVRIEYEDVLGIRCEEWGFFLAPKCVDITIRTKQGELPFRFIHTPMSKANGITETPFNIIRERIGLTYEDEHLLIDRAASVEQKRNFRS
ncbi:MAG: hypothetical protein IJT87_12540 [Ruminiclostridium sp.]|nr:hypothetical protein [Ruminiclostridium sp.]